MLIYQRVTRILSWFYGIYSWDIHGITQPGYVKIAIEAIEIVDLPIEHGDVP